MDFETHKDPVLVISEAVVIGVNMTVHFVACPAQLPGLLLLKELLDARKLLRCAKVSVACALARGVRHDIPFVVSDL